MVIFGDLLERIPGADGQLHPIHTGDTYDQVSGIGSSLSRVLSLHVSRACQNVSRVCLNVSRVYQNVSSACKNVPRVCQNVSRVCFNVSRVC